MSREGKVAIVTAGHVDAGKSTTCGVLLMQVGAVSERDKSKFFEEAQGKGKDSFGFAFTMDRTKEEQERVLRRATPDETSHVPDEARKALKAVEQAVAEIPSEINIKKNV